MPYGAEGRMMELLQQRESKDIGSGISEKTNEESEHEAFLRQLHNQSGISGLLLEHEPGSILDDNWDPAMVEEVLLSGDIFSNQFKFVDS
ncbi:unnamed protein product [Dibothriocephalus latus]|uniref:Uncharacterized protein n=1 Tax=Dibothriocephalus latus TaxID=60516 RepID=A0A3P7M1F8_DIBLA|nr:unnamed protein product [Dibothriocephalus latus]